MWTVSRARDKVSRSTGSPVAEWLGIRGGESSQAGHMSHVEVWILQAAEGAECAKAATITASIPSTGTGANKSSLKAQLREYKDEGSREICTTHRKLKTQNNV